MANKPNDIKEMRNLVNEMRKLFGDISESVDGVSKKTAKWKQNVEGLKDLAKEYKQEIKDAETSQKVKNLSVEKGIDIQVAELMIAKEQAKVKYLYNNMTKANRQEFDKQYDTAINLAKKAAEQRKIQEEQAELAKKIAKYDHERKEIIEKITEKQKLLKDIFTDQRLAAAVFTAQMIKGAESVTHAFQHIREEGFTMTQALTKTGKAAQIAFNPFNPVNMKEALGAMKGLTEELGSMDNVTKDTIKQSAMLAKTFGISTEMAGKLTGQMMQLPGATAETAKSTLDYAGGLAKAANVAPGKVMAEIANNSEAFALYAKDGGKNVATAAIAATKLGIEFSGLTKMADTLLDFESSINKQMEASVLLGREINLDKAREAALNGDLVTATQEVLKNVGGEAEFNRMNLMQRKALADSMGVSVQDLSKMVKNQDKLNDLTQEQREALADGSLTMDEIAASAGGYLGKMKEAGLTIFSAVKSFGELGAGLQAANQMATFFKNTKLATYIAEKAQGAWKMMFGAKEIAQENALAAAKQRTAAAEQIKGGGPSAQAGKLSKINAGSLIKAAGAMLIAAAAIYVFGKAIQELDKIKDWKNVAIGLGLFVGALAAVAAIAYFAAPALYLAAPALLAFGASIALFGLGLNLATPAIKAFGDVIIGVLGAAPAIITAIADGFVKMFTTISENIIALLALGPALMMIGAGLSIMSAAGIGAIPVLGALAALAVVAPALGGLGSSIGGMFGGGNEEESKMDRLMDKLDTFANAILNQQVVLKLDSKELEATLRLNTNSRGVR